MSAPKVPPPNGVSSRGPAAGTPSPLDEVLTREALETVELEAALELVAANAAGELAAARLRALRPTIDIAWVRRELAGVGEVAALFRRGDALVAEPVPDLSRALGRLRIEGSVLEGTEVSRIRGMLARRAL